MTAPGSADAAAPTVRYLVNGEPTGNRLAAATKGVWRARLIAAGRAAHSALPHLGDSAIEKLVSALHHLRAIPLPADPTLGRTTYSVGLISGGTAPNVVPDHAECELIFRTVGPVEPVRRALAPLDALVRIEDILTVAPARMVTLPDFDTAIFPFTTDVSLLPSWGRPLLLGPGEIDVAHTDEEHVRIDDLCRAVDQYAAIGAILLTTGHA